MPLVSDPGPIGWCGRPSNWKCRCRRCPGPCGRRSPRWRIRGCRRIRSGSADFCRLSRGSGPKALEALAEEQATAIFYEAPHRILEALEAIELALGPRPVVVARELTKIHEEFSARDGGGVAGPAGGRGIRCAAKITLLIGKATGPAPRRYAPWKRPWNGSSRAGTARMDASSKWSRKRGLSKRKCTTSCYGRN